MRTKITLILLVFILVGCTKNADIESVNIPVEPASQTVLPKISKDISVLSADDAISNINKAGQHGRKAVLRVESMIIIIQEGW